MTINEMSQEFDILYNQVNSNQASSVDEYEKSVFLTKAQDELIKAYFDPRGNKFIEGFDDGQKRQYDFSLLVVNKKLDEISDYNVVEQYDPRSYIYVMPSDLLLTLNESVVEKSGGINYIYQIIPISYTQYGVLMQKPYQYPTKRAVWRLITGQVMKIPSPQRQDEKDFAESTKSSVDDIIGTEVHETQVKKDLYTYCEIIGRFKNKKAPEYKMRYVKKPTPIILVDLNTEYEGLSIDGYFGNEKDIAVYIGQNNKEILYDGSSDHDPIGIPCKLPEGIHHEIVQRAVELATAVYNPQALGNIAGVGNVSATNLGIVPRQESK